MAKFHTCLTVGPIQLLISFYFRAPWEGKLKEIDTLHHKQFGVLLLEQKVKTFNFNFIIKVVLVINALDNLV